MFILYKTDINILNFQSLSRANNSSCIPNGNKSQQKGVRGVLKMEVGDGGGGGGGGTYVYTVRIDLF